MNVIYDIAKRNKLLPKYSEIILYFRYPFRKMSVVSKVLWKYQFLYDKNVSSISLAYNIFRVFNLYTILSVETISLAKVLLKTPINKLIENCSILKFNNFKIEFKPERFNKVIILNEINNNDDVILRNIDLDLIFVSIVLRLFNFEIQDNIIILSKDKKYRKYNELIALIKCIIEIDKNVNQLGTELINQTLRNQDFNSNINIDDCITNLKNSIETIGIIRKSLKNYKRINTKKDSYKDMTLLNFKDYFNFPMTKQEELFKQKNIKTIDIKNKEIISIITPTNNLLELWKQVYFVKYNRLIVPSFLSLLWLILTFSSILNIQSKLLNFVILILIFLIGILLDKIFDKMKIIRKLYKLLGIKR